MCSSKLELKEFPDGDYQWAILQTYREDVGSRDQSLKIDGPPNGNKTSNCQNYIKVANLKIPFYSSSLYLPHFSDQPTYDCNDPGRIVFYTIFAEITSINKDYSACKYEFKFGLKWGIQMEDDRTINSIPISKLRGNELQTNVKRFTSVFCKGTFILSLI